MSRSEPSPIAGQRLADMARPGPAAHDPGLRSTTTPASYSIDRITSVVRLSAGVGTSPRTSLNETDRRIEAKASAKDTKCLHSREMRR